MPCAIANGNAFAGEHGPIAVLEIDDLVGEGRQRDGVGAHEHLALADADGERAALARHDHQIIIAAEDHGDGKGALQPLQRVEGGAHGIGAGFHLPADQMRDDFGIGIAGESGAALLQLLLQLAEILDDAVMHDRDVLGHMRMRVRLGGLAVCRPAGVADAGLAEQRLAGQARFEIAQLAFGATPAERAVLDGGNARGVVAAIFKPLQCVDQLTRNGAFTEDANNAAHRPLLHPNSLLFLEHDLVGKPVPTFPDHAPD